MKTSGCIDKAIVILKRFYGSRWFSYSIIFLGILLRMRHYLFNRCLWVDEVSIALNVINRSFSEFFQALDYNQFAPIGFLVVEKVMVQAFGSSEYVFRALPLIAGIASLFLFYKAAQWFIRPEAIPIAPGLFAISKPLVYYSA